MIFKALKFPNDYRQYPQTFHHRLTLQTPIFINSKSATQATLRSTPIRRKLIEITVFHTMDTPFNADGRLRHTRRPVELAVVRVDVTIRSTHHPLMHGALSNALTARLTICCHHALSSFHAVMDQTWICENKLS